MGERAVIWLDGGERVFAPKVCVEQCPSLDHFVREAANSDTSEVAREIAKAQVRGIAELALETECQGPFEARSHLRTITRKFEPGPDMCTVTFQQTFGETGE